MDDMSRGESQFGDFEAFALPLVAEFQSRRFERRQRQRAGPLETGVDLATAVQLEMLRTLRTMRRGNGGGGDFDEADDENDDGFLRRSKAGGINELHRIHKQFSERPLARQSWPTSRE